MVGEGAPAVDGWVPDGDGAPVVVLVPGAVPGAVVGAAREPGCVVVVVPTPVEPDWLVEVVVVVRRVSVEIDCT